MGKIQSIYGSVEIGYRDSFLSEREIEVLKLVAKGLSNLEIGRSLHISKSTVKTHLIHIFRKLNATDRTSAVTAAIEHKFIRITKM